MTKKSSGFSKLLTNVLLVIPSILNIACHVVEYIEFEARLAKRSLIILVVLLVFSVALVVGAWFCLCAMVYLWLQTKFTPMGAASVLLLSHVILLFIVALWMARLKENLLFSRTRSLFHN